MSLSEALATATIDELGDLVDASVRSDMARDVPAESSSERSIHAGLVAAVVASRSYDALAEPGLRTLLASQSRIASPERWVPGSPSARQFVDSIGLDPKYGEGEVGDGKPSLEVLPGRTEARPLLDYQEEVVTQIVGVLRSSAKALVSLPTGAGKTRTAVEGLFRYVHSHTRQSQEVRTSLIWAAHSEELCEQAIESIKDVWLWSGVCHEMIIVRAWGGAFNANEARAACAATSGDAIIMIVGTPVGAAAAHRSLSQADRSDVSGLAVIIIDEAHRAAARTYRELVRLGAEAKPPAAILGLTATPYRTTYSESAGSSGTQELIEVFDGKLLNATQQLGPDPRRTLQRRGILASLRFTSIPCRRPLSLPESVLHRSEAEADAVLAKQADNPERRAQSVAELVRACADSRARVLYFGPSVADANAVAVRLLRRDIKAAVVSGRTTRRARRMMIDEFKRGKLQVLCNCELLTTGFDAPLVTHIVVGRPTVSLVLYEQMIGRGLRGPVLGGTAICNVIEFSDVLAGADYSLASEAYRSLWQDQND